MKKILILLLVVFLVACNQEELTYEGLIQEVNRQRQSVSDNIIDETDYLILDDVETFTDEEIMDLLQPSQARARLLSQEEAIEDVETLFKIFRNDYGGYEAFGGDQMFDSAKEAILKDLGQINEVYINDLEDLIAGHLTFINDGHLHIGRHDINASQTLVYYSNEQLAFEKDDKGYFLGGENKKYLETINDEEVEPFMKLSLDEEGHLVYYIGLLKEEGPVLEKVTITYGGVTEEIDLFKAPRAHNDRKKSFKEDLVDGLPILSLRTCEDKPGETIMKDFVASARKYRDSEILVLDLRGNGGGSSHWSELWLKNLTGQDVKRAGLEIQRTGSINKFLFSQAMKQQHQYYMDLYEMPELEDYIESFYQSHTDLIDGSYEAGYFVTSRDHKIIERDQTIFVLIDKGVGSSGEDFVENLKRLENVVLVGSNTGGFSDIGNMIHLYLPNSRINVFVGLRLDLKQEAPHLFDGVGLSPDLYLANSGMLDRLIKFINTKSTLN